MSITAIRTRKSKFSSVATSVVAFADSLPGTVAFAAGTSIDAEGAVPVRADWMSSGQNSQNTWHAPLGHTINAGKLKPKWTLTTAGDITVTATVVDGIVYVPDWGGKLWAIDAKAGKAIWSHDVSDYTAKAVRPRVRDYPVTLDKLLDRLPEVGWPDHKQALARR